MSGALPRAGAGGGADFASALYLGMRHPWSALGPWDALTGGVPAALAPPPGAEAVARRVAALQGAPAATLLPSTLHLFLDLFALLAPGAAGVLVDEGAYAVARWAAERARCAGAAWVRFRHHHPGALARALGRLGRPGRALVLCDGFCPDCGRPAPLPDYLEAVRRAGGTLVVDDTQALGVFGAAPGPGAPYGSGGGGSLARWGIGGAPEVAAGASLAKAFGAPVAVLSGSRELVRRFEDASGTRVHCSPPSAAAVAAAARALALNPARGDALRARLADRVERFRRLLAARGLAARGGRFPVQTLAGLADPAAAHARLAGEGVRAVLRAAPEPRLTFLLRADHSDHDLARAADAVARAAGLTERRRRCRTETSGCRGA